jgi:sugar/nucleoside kinase (ribokinase family)
MSKEGLVRSLDYGSSSHPNVAVCGNLTIDELVHRDRVTISPGGSALFASGAAVTLGADASILGNIGEDYPQPVARHLKTLCVDTRLLHRTEGPSTRFRITRSNGSRKLQLLAPGEPIIFPSGLILFQGIHLGPVFNEISSSFVKAIRRRCYFLSADLQGFIRTASSTGSVHTPSQRLDDLLRQCNMVQASIEEARSQIHHLDPMKILDHFRAYKVPYLIITMGGRGSLLSADDYGVFFIPAFRDPNIRDSTGAGDVFAGSWLTTYLATNDPVWASAVGSAFASLACQRSGIAKFRVDRRELFRRAGYVYNRTKLVSS